MTNEQNGSPRCADVEDYENGSPRCARDDERTEWVATLSYCALCQRFLHPVIKSHQRIPLFPVIGTSVKPSSLYTPVIANVVKQSILSFS